MRHDEYYRHKNNKVAKAFYENRETLLAQNQGFREHKVTMEPGEDIWTCKVCFKTWRIIDFPDAPYFLWQECQMPSELIKGLVENAPVNDSMTEKLKRGHKLFSRGKLFQEGEIGMRAQVGLASGQYFSGSGGYDMVDFSADPDGLWVFNRTTKKYFCLGFKELYELAIEAGINSAGSFAFIQNNNPNK